CSGNTDAKRESARVDTFCLIRTRKIGTIDCVVVHTRLRSWRNRDLMGRVTLQDIAARVGVDRSTVSRVLSNKAAEGGISSELAQRIFREAQDLNYIPNTSARAIRMRRFN